MKPGKPRKEAPLEQAESSNYCVLSIELPSKIQSSSPTSGRATYYQWGRKDPIMLNSYVSSFSVSSSQMSGFGSSYYLSIQNPQKVYTNTNCWFGGTSYAVNIWNANNSTTSTNKTIYDPCPAGFKVPNYQAYFNQTNPASLSRIQGIAGFLNASVSSVSDAHCYYTWTSMESVANSASYLHNKKNATTTYDYFTSGATNLKVEMPIIPIVD